VKDERLHNALIGSLKLSGLGQYQEALRLMDEVIAEAIKEGDELTALVLIDHAALLNGVKRDRSLAKHYYEQFLTHSPESPRVLYELADAAMEDGQIEVAKQYAKRCH
jgi:Tfp pilus assembly protein PilF